MRTQILLADDHQVVLDGLASLLAKEPDMQVVGQATDGLEVLGKVKELRPEVLVVDLMMPGMNGLEVTRQVHSQVPDTKVIVLSMHANDAYVAEALRNGASGYVVKQANARALVLAIRAVMEGEHYLSPPLSEERIALLQQEVKESPLEPFDLLSKREREVMQLAAEGLTSAEIGDRLKIGRRTVETHRANLQRKLGIKSHSELVKLAVKKGLVGVD
ncbi:MAG TPA: response regulator transcription factor [Polyangia bacterium]|jgi:DNA-binding NarL/FixJ family response regulator